MYEELSAETDEFFNFMLDNDLLDLVAKKGKAGGGYCTYIENYKAPFIFSNFNGTSGDIVMLSNYMKAVNLKFQNIMGQRMKRVKSIL